MVKIYEHPDQVSGITVLEDGTMVLWTEGQGSDLVIVTNTTTVIDTKGPTPGGQALCRLLEELDSDDSVVRMEMDSITQDLYQRLYRDRKWVTDQPLDDVLVIRMVQRIQIHEGLTAIQWLVNNQTWINLIDPEDDAYDRLYTDGREWVHQGDPVPDAVRVIQLATGVSNGPTAPGEYKVWLTSALARAYEDAGYSAEG